jgi:DNA polymerase-3 subunit epsilon
MKIILLDTETSGLPNFRAQSDDPSQPHMLQLAALKIEMVDEGLPTFTEFNHFVKPEGWEVDERLVGDDGKPTAFSIHGISNEKLHAVGRPLAEIMDEFDAEFLAWADEALAYGAGFDRRILRIAAMRRWGRTGHPRMGAAPLPWFCILETVKPIIDLPPTEKMMAAGFGGKPKPPKLAEAYRFAFGKELEGAHDAMVDLRATFDLWKWVRAKHGGEFKRIVDRD